MTETEKRRAKLLEHTRKIYSDRYTPPAVHPRFHSTYQSLYQQDTKQDEEGGTFGIRMIMAILLFCLFIAASRSDFQTEMVVQGIEQEFQSFVDLPILD